VSKRERGGRIQSEVTCKYLPWQRDRLVSEEKDSCGIWTNEDDDEGTRWKAEMEVGGEYKPGRRG
jgi:hypothetical protein